MSKPTLLFRGAVKTRSGYGAHSRDLLEALYQMDMFDIKIDSCMWGNTPMTALDNNNEFHKWIENNIVINFNGFRNFFGGYDTHSFGVLYKPNHFCINWVFTL